MPNISSHYEPLTNCIRLNRNIPIVKVTKVQLSGSNGFKSFGHVGSLREVQKSFSHWPNAHASRWGFGKSLVEERTLLLALSAFEFVKTSPYSHLEALLWPITWRVVDSGYCFSKTVLQNNRSFATFDYLNCPFDVIQCSLPRPQGRTWSPTWVYRFAQPVNRRRSVETFFFGNWKPI